MNPSNTVSFSETKQEIVDLAVENPQLSDAAIADSVGVHPSLVRQVRETYFDEPATSEPVPWSDYDSVPSETEEQAGTDSKPTAKQSAETTHPITAHSQPLRRFKHLFRTIQDAVVEVECIADEPIICGVNPAFEDVFGYDASDIIGQSLTGALVPEEAETQATELHEEIATGDYIDAVVSRQTANGTRQFLLRAVPAERVSKQYAFAIYSDITSLKRREAELEQKIQQFEEFASVLTHDIRNPINIAEGTLEQIKTPENEDRVSRIENAHDRIKTLVDDTLVLTRESDAITDTASVPIETIVNGAWDVVETKEADLEVVDQFTLTCDRTRVSRLFENLFRNAIEHNDESVTIRVGIHNTMGTSTRENTATAFYVADDGVGIPSDDRERLFDIGETTAATGTGLGLAIVERIVDAHQWNIHITESEADGAKFVISNAELSR